ncbi:oxidoreductase [Psychromicrobium lacuslunae]|uniref:Oxidoreductase n=2 Tax=Psychromicrobium lacuslunae TaxID=1618207 RepID=A0A0D4C311_9MICC|nr:oxidoreductase [Psychromicrobium lacuslunae]
MSQRIIVIGAGSAGSIVSRRLVDAGHQVTVLEAGGPVTNPAIQDISRAGELWHSEQDWDYYTVPQANAAGRRLHLPRGKVLGGSHALNAMIYVRCAAQDFDGWAAAGNPGWSWQEVLPTYLKIENFDGGPSEVRSTGGPLDVLGDYPLQPIQQSIIDAAVQTGLAHNPDYNSGQLDGISQVQLTVRDGERLSSYRAYLEPVAGAENLEILTNAQAVRLLIDDGVVLGVEYVIDGEEVQQLYADQVFLCAGALDSPALLLRSGIGPAEELSELGIEVVHDLPGVGKNLHDHFLVPVIFGTSKRRVEPPKAGQTPAQTHLFWRSQPDLEVPDTQPINFSVPMYQDELSGPETGFSLMAGLIGTQSRGSLRLSGPSIDDEVLIDLAALADPADLRALLASVRQCREIGRAAALAEEWGAAEIHPGPEVADQDLEDYVRANVVTYHHQVGSCKMGIDQLAVVDPQLRVHGIAGLRIADASIMPQVTSGNTNAPVMLIAEKAVEFFLTEH